MEKQKRKRVLRRTPNSNGCGTCRARRVKCDGSRPVCQKCTDGQRECKGYSSWNLIIQADTTTRETSIALEVDSRLSSVHSSRSPTPSTAYGSPGSISRVSSPYPSELNNDSHRALLFFVEHTVDYMLEQSAAAHQTFRHVQTALTVSFEHPTLMLAIASVALSYRAMSTVVHPGSLTRPAQPGQRDHALQYFGKVIEQMKNDMQSARDENELGPILLGCMFLFVFELMLGNDTDAVAHMRMGRNLAQAFQSDRCLPSDHPFQIAKTWLSMGGVDTSSSAPRRRRLNPDDIDSREVSPRLNIATLMISSVADFTSIKEASAQLEVLEERRRKIQAELFDAAGGFLIEHHPQSSSPDSAKRLCLTYTLSRVIPMTSQNAFDEKLEQCIGGYLSWKVSLEKVLQSQQSESGDSLLLQIRYFNGLFSICNCRETRESSTDTFRSEFVEVLDYVENFLEHWSSRAPHLERTSPDLSSQQALRGTGIFEWGPLPALATVAVKCRDSHIRRRAIDMLFTARRREGNHSSLTLSLWTETIAELEDKRTVAVLGEQAVTGTPECARFADIAVCADEHDESVFHVYTARFEHEDQGDVELTKYSRAVNGVFGTAFQTIRTPCEPRSVKDLGGEIKTVYREKFRRPSSMCRILA